MRLSVVASVLSVFAVAALVGAPGPAGAAKSKMGCEIGSEVWNAGAGRCEPGSPKWKKADSDKKSAVAEAPGKKAAKKKTPAKK
jgi:hypothetical protein